MDESTLILAIGELIVVLFYHSLMPLLVLSVFGLVLALCKRSEPLAQTLHLSWLFWLCWSSSLHWPPLDPSMSIVVPYVLVSAGLGIYIATDPSNEFMGATPKAGMVCVFILLLGMLPFNPAPKLATHHMLIQTAMHIGVPYLLQRIRHRQGKFVNVNILRAGA